MSTPAACSWETAATVSAESSRGALRAVEATVATDDALGWDASENAISKALASADVTEGLSAFAKKRPPRWQGR